MIIKDYFGKYFQVKNFSRFLQNIEKYHTIKGEADGSVHTEDGYVFIITNNFIKKY